MKETDIRPEALLNHYLQLSAEDAERCFSGVAREDRSCVACGALETQTEFVQPIAWVRTPGCLQRKFERNL